MNIHYLNGLYAWEDFSKKVFSEINEHKHTKVAEIGGGANPLLPLEFIASNAINYHVYDISEEELSKTERAYQTIIADVASKDFEAKIQYHFIFSQLTVEHIEDIETFYKNIYRMLEPGGTAFLFFACKTMLPTRLNSILPEFISSKLLMLIQPFRKDEKHGKFKAHYQWCFGPTKKNIKRFQDLNFEIVLYNGYFGHSYYKQFRPLQHLENVKTRYLLNHPNPDFCSYSHILLMKK